MPMRSGRGAEGCWPDDRQTLLLQAALSDADDAVAAWKRWRSMTTLEHVTGGDTPALAVVYRRIHRLVDDDPMLAVARGVYKRTWYLNQLALRRAADAISVLRDASVDVLVLKGVALTLLHYGDVGARPMEDIDLLVGPERLDAAVEALGASGWRPLATQTAGGPLRYGTHVEDSNRNEIDLHAYALMQSADDSDLWQHQVPLDVLGVPTATLAPADQLLHVCAHGLRWDFSTVRWVLDAMMILRAGGAEFDWERLVERARARRLTVAVGRALTWLQETLQAGVPASVLARLDGGPRLRFERAVHHVQARPPSRLGFAVMSFDRYRRFAQLAPADRRPRSFPEYLRNAWGLERSSDLLIHGGRRLVSRSS